MNPTTIEIPNKQAQAVLDPKQQETRELMVGLGRAFMQTIEVFFQEKNKPAELFIIMGALDYIIRAHKERRNVLSNDFLLLKKLVEQAEVKVHEPFVNDGISPAVDVFEQESK
jgi:hypothetical protein